MTIEEAYKIEKIQFSLMVQVYPDIENFIKKWIGDADRYLAVLKNQPTYFQYSRDGGNWTDAGAKEMMSFIHKKIADEKADGIYYDPLPEGNDTTNLPNGPFAALEQLCLEPKGELQDYSTRLYEGLKSVYQNLRAMEDFKEEQKECFRLMYEVQDGNINWEEVQLFSALLVKIAKANVPEPTMWEAAIADASTYLQMYTLCTDGVKSKIISKENAGQALNIYHQGLTISKGLGQRKMREYLRKVAP